MNQNNIKSSKTIISNLENFKKSKNLLQLEKEGQILLVNTLSIQPLLVTHGKELIKSALKAIGTSIKDPPGDEQLYQLLFDRNIILHSSKEETPPQADYKYRPEDRKSGMTLYLLISQDCNLRCKYCFADEFPYRQKQQMSFNVASRAIEKNVNRLLANGSMQIVFFGGEPLMNWPLIKDVIVFVEQKIKPYHKKKELKYHVTTNLTNLPEDFIPWVKQYNITILTDVDGHRAQEHDFLRPAVDGKSSFERIVNNIDLLKKEGIRVEVRSTIAASNQKQIFNISKKLKEFSGVGSVLELITPFDCSQNPISENLLPDIDIYLEDMKKIYKSGKPPVENIFPINKHLEKIRSGKGSPIGCGMPWGNIHVIDYRGDVYMCTYLVGQEKYKMGNVFDEGLTYSNEQEAVNHAFMNVHVDHVPACSKCSWKYICSGHCPIARLALEANEANGKPMPAYVKKYTFKKSCKMTRTFYEMLLWDLANNKLPLPPEEKRNINTEPICCT